MESLIRAAAIVILWCGAALGAMRVEQLIQAPADRAQSINSLAADRNGNLILTGTNVRGGFATKLDPQGNTVFTFANFGSFPTGAVADPNGDIYWIGSAGFDFPFTKKILPADRGSRSSGFAVKFRGENGSIVWALEIESLQPQAIALDSLGRIVLAGRSTAGEFAPLGIVRLTADGDAISMRTYGGRSVNGVRTCVSGQWFLCSSDPVITASSVLVGAEGHIWVTGFTNEIDLPITPGALKKTCGCSLASGDGYLAEFSADGVDLLYATYLGTPTRGENDGSGDDVIRAAAMDATGRIWLAGSTNGAGLPVTSDAAQTTLIGDGDGFLIAYDPAANRIVYGTYYGTEGTNSITRLAIDPAGRPVFAGHLNSNLYNPYSFGTDFVAALTPSGIESMPFLHNGADAGLAFSPSGALVVAGSGSAIATLKDSNSTSPSIFGVGNAASLQASGQVCAGEIVSIAGAHFGTRNLRVLFDGLPASILSASEDRIDAIVPFGVADRKETKLVVEWAGVRSNEARLGVVPAAPAIFTTNSVTRYLPVAAAINQDGTINSEDNPATSGSIVTILGSGFGALSPAPPDGSIASAPLPRLVPSVDMFGPSFVEILYAGPAPRQVAGVTQINFRVETESAGPPTIVLFSGGWAANYFTVWVR